MIKLANKFDVLSAIDTYLQESIKHKQQRTYMGGSILGKECDRQLWYEYKEPIANNNPRVERIFHLGHLLESYVISLLKHSGYVVHHDDGSGQYGFKDEELAGHIDGVIELDGVPHLLEIKSASDKRFSEMVKKGVRLSDPVYFVQMQVYMKYMELDKALFVAINKNDCSIHSEVVEYDPMTAEHAVNRGKEIARMEDKPERKYKSPAFLGCKFCNYKDKCWNESV
jgi:CRISPR/Cas system-associated exonuclease Cas4 (RecB family)